MLEVPAMAEDDDALEGLHKELEKLSRRIDDLDRKLIILRGRNPVTTVCVVPTIHGNRGTRRSAMSTRSITPTVILSPRPGPQ